ncbi:MAG: trigger factor [Candidatus Moranbacteria bacterium]|nr:trigger factor [Candidatus Moranbacteria bacterium]
MIKKLPNSQIEINISISWDVWKGYLDKAAEEISKEINIPGFRPGKAPRNIVEQKVGKNIILNKAAEKAVQKSYADFITKEKIESLGAPEVELKEIAEGKDLEYSAKVSVMPEIKLDEKYKKEIKKINEDFKKRNISIDDAEIQLELEKLANTRAKLITVRREAQKGDAVEIDFEVTVAGVPIEGGSSKKHPLVIGKGVFIPGFEDNLIGMPEGGEKSFELSFPAEYHQKDLAGKMAKFSVKMNLVQERQIPEINNEFAKSLGKFETLEAVKKNMREGLEHEQKHKLEEEKRTKYLDKIIDNLIVDLPKILVQSEIEKMIAEFEYQVQSMGMSLDDYLGKISAKGGSASGGKTKADLKKDWQPQAIKRVKSALALKEIAKVDEIKADSKEIEEEMNKTLQYYKNMGDIEKKIDTGRLYNYVKGNLENEKVFERLEKL